MDIQRKNYWILIGTIILLIGIIYPISFKTDVWPEDLHLEKFPQKIGDWHLTDEESVKENFLPEGLERRPVGMKTINRKYTNSLGNSLWLYIGYFNYREGPFNHEPARCYVSQGWDLLDESKESIKLSGKEISINKVQAQKGLYQQIAIYWFQVGDEIIIDKIKHQISILKKTLFSGRFDGVVVSITTDVGAGKIGEIVEFEKKFAEEILPIIPEYLPK